MVGGMTFGEAMEILMGGEPVEVGAGASAVRFMPGEGGTEDFVTVRRWMVYASWRRARPKRSRVQEMFASEDFQHCASKSIRIVCEWLKTEPGQNEARVDKNFGGFLARAIEREFLEPR